MNEGLQATSRDRIWTRQEVIDLLKMKKIVFIGDSNVRTWYKDLIVFIKNKAMLTPPQCSSRIQPTFEGDRLVVTNYGDRNARGRLTTEHRRFHCAYKENEIVIEFYFITKLFSNYVQSIIDKWTTISGPLEDDCHVPDIIFIQSFCWDITRWGPSGCKQYSKSLQGLCSHLRACKPIEHTTIAFISSPPLTADFRGGFIVPELGFLKESMRYHVMEARLAVRRAAIENNFDFIDVYPSLLHILHKRRDDGIHWMPAAIRLIIHGLLNHLWRRQIVMREQDLKVEKPLRQEAFTDQAGMSITLENPGNNTNYSRASRNDEIESSVNNDSGRDPTAVSTRKPTTIKDIEDNIIGRILTRASLIEQQNSTTGYGNIQAEESFGQDYDVSLPEQLASSERPIWIDDNPEQLFDGTCLPVGWISFEDRSRPTPALYEQNGQLQPHYIQGNRQSPMDEPHDWLRQEDSASYKGHDRMRSPPFPERIIHPTQMGYLDQSVLPANGPHPMLQRWNSPPRSQCSSLPPRLVDRSPTPRPYPGSPRPRHHLWSPPLEPTEPMPFGHTTPYMPHVFHPYPNEHIYHPHGGDRFYRRERCVSPDLMGRHNGGRSSAAPLIRPLMKPSCSHRPRPKRQRLA